MNSKIWENYAQKTYNQYKNYSKIYSKLSLKKTNEIK